MLKRFVCLLLLIGTSSISPLSSQAIKLFSPEMRQTASKPQIVVMDFMERYFNELATQKRATSQAKMADDKVYFKQGNLSCLQQRCDTMPCSFSLVDSHHEVTWTKAGQPFVTVVFPAQYDLLLGQQKDVAVQLFKNAVISSQPHTVQPATPFHLQPDGGSIFQSAGETFLMAGLTDTYYYNKVGTGYRPVFDRQHLAYSAANLFHGLTAEADYRMFVEQSVYGMKTVNYTITLSQWLNYCAEWGLKVFFAVEEEREDGLLTLIVAQSKELGCHHLLSVIIPDKFIDDPNAVLKVKLTPYIPTGNSSPSVISHSTFSVAHNEAARQINIVKRDTTCLYAEATMRDLGEATSTAKTLLEVKVGDWLRSHQVTDTFSIAKVKDYSSEIHARRGELHRAFVYVRKSDLMPVDDKNGITSPQPTLTKDERQMAAITRFYDIEPFVKALDTSGCLAAHGKYATMPKDDKCHIFVYNKAGEVAAVLRKTADGCLNLRTLKPDDIQNYKNCGAIWLQMK